MWKRLNNSRGTRQPLEIGTPVLQETTLDQNAYSSMDGLRMSPTERSEPPPRPQRDIVPKQLPRLPFDAMPPSPEPEDSRYRPASSVYSQALPTPIVTRFPNDSYATVQATYIDDVSPPSSPDMRAHRQANDDEVSPIDETPDVSRLNLGRVEGRPSSSSRPPTSSIPVLRRGKRRNQVAAAASNLLSRKELGNGSRGRTIVDPRWDPYSGEITTSDRGKPQSVKPGQFTPPGLQPIHNTAGPVLGNQSIITAGQKPHTSFGDRVRKLKTNNASAERPEWKGASGRVALVSPVEDQPDTLPLSIPRKSSRRVASLSPVSVIRSDETTPEPAQTSRQSDHPRALFSDTEQSNSRATSPILVTPDPVIVSQSAAVRTQARGHPNPTEVQPSTLANSDTTGTIERNFREALQDSFPEIDSSDPYVQPSSRFSVTTYAPSEAQATPRPSTDTWDCPPMPTPPPATTPSPIVNRKRPKVAESPKATVSRKAIPPASPILISMSSTMAHKRQSALSTISKNLPQSPAEASSHDLITSLQAQLDNLTHRRNNITRSIKQMTELMPTDGLIVTTEVRAKRELEKLKVEGLRKEEADVRREEHEIGLRLHRAFKRKDKEAVYEPTGLWVRRVTG